MIHDIQTTRFMYIRITSISDSNTEIIQLNRYTKLIKIDNQSLVIPKNMSIQNTKITITPLSITYNINKSFPILIKQKRISIGTNYQLDKWQCKKQLILKDGYIDLQPYSKITTFCFKINRQLELHNTKIQIIVFEFINKDIKDVKLRGLAIVELNLFQYQSLENKIFEKQMKLPLEKCQDRHAFITISISIENIGKNSYQSNKSTIKTQSSQLNSIKTQSHNKQQLSFYPKKKPNTTSTNYQINHQNLVQIANNPYKKSQIQKTRNNHTRSRQRSTSNSYKKRFKYQYNRYSKNQQHQQQQQRQQAPPPKQRYREKQDKNSPMPRIKTPQPITYLKPNIEINNTKNENISNQTSHLHYSSLHNHKIFDQSINISYSQSYQRNNACTDHKSSSHIINRHKITIDVHRQNPRTHQNYFCNHEQLEQQNHVIAGGVGVGVGLGVSGEKQNIEKDEERIKFIKEGQWRKQNIGKIQHNSGKKGEVHSSSGKKQNRYNNQNWQQIYDNIYTQTQICQKYDQQLMRTHKDNNNQGEYSEIYQPSASKNNNDDIYEPLPTPQLTNNPPNILQKSVHKNNIIEILPKNSPKYHQQPQPQPRPQPQKPLQPKNTFKQITQKFQQITNKLNKQKNQLSSPNTNKISSLIQINQKNKINNLTTSNYHQRIHSPTKPSNQQQYKQTKTVIQSSGNTFKQQYFSSNIDISPQNSNIKQIKSFNYERQSNPDNIRDRQKQWQKQQNAKLTGRFISNRHSDQQQINQHRRNQNTQLQEKLDHLSHGDSRGEICANQSPRNCNGNGNQSGIDTFGKNSENVVGSSLSNLSSGNNFSMNNIGKNDNNDIDDEKGQHAQNQNKSNDIACQTQPIKSHEETLSPQSQNHHSKTQYQITKLYSYLQLPSTPQHPPIKYPSIQQQSKDKLKQKYQQQIKNLQNTIEQQEENHRKILMEKQLQYKNIAKQQKKIKQLTEKQLEKLKQQNIKLHTNHHSNKQSKYHNIITQLQKLKQQYINIKVLNEKLNTLLEESDRKQYMLGINHKKQIDELQQINNKLRNQIKQKQLQIQQCTSFNPQTNSLPTISTTSQPKLNASNPSSPDSQLSFNQQNIAMKQQSIKYQRQLRKIQNDLKIANIKIEKLSQDKTNLENQIDHMVTNRNSQLQKQGSVNRLNLQSATAANNMIIQNQILKQQIDSLQSQIHQLNILFEAIIREGGINSDKISELLQQTAKQNQQSLLKKYRTLEEINRNNEQEIKNKQMKIADLINLIFGQQNAKLMEELQKIIWYKSQ